MNLIALRDSHQPTLKWHQPLWKAADSLHNFAGGFLQTGCLCEKRGLVGRTTTENAHLPKAGPSQSNMTPKGSEENQTRKPQMLQTSKKPQCAIIPLRQIQSLLLAPDVTQHSALPHPQSPSFHIRSHLLTPGTLFRPFQVIYS